MTAGIKNFLTLLVALLWVNGACAQTYNQMTWGFTLPSGSPYNFGANIQGNWYNLGTVSSAGEWGLNPFTINVPNTGHLFVDNGASISRLGDRVFAGGYDANTGSCCFVQGGWLSNYSGQNPPINSNGDFSVAAITTYNSLVAGSPDAAQALTVGARTALQTTAAPTVYPLNVILANDNTTLPMAAWGIYLEAHAMNNVVEETTGAELEVVNRGSNVYHDPFGFYQHHQVTDYQAGCGAGLPATGQYPCGYAFGIFRNPMTFNEGIVFASDSLSTAKGFAEAMQMGSNHWIEWWGAQGAMTWRIGSTQTTGGNGNGANTINLLSGGVSINADSLLGYQGVNKALVIGDSVTAGIGTAVNGAGALGIASGTTYSLINDPRLSAQLIIGTGTSTAQTIVGSKTTFGGGIVMGGTAPTNSGSCAINTQLGGNTGGSFRANGACAGGTVVLTFATTATNGWACTANDLTTPANTVKQTGYAATTATFTATMTSADLVTFNCVGF